MLTPELRVLRSKLANAALRAKYPPKELTKAAVVASQTALNQRLIAQNNIDETAPVEEFKARLKAARSEHYRRMRYEQLKKAAK